MKNQVICGDCKEVLCRFPPNTFDTIITDPPYGLGFMGKEWDHGVPGVVFWQICFRVAKPGAMMLVFGGTRTYHRPACAIEDAGWEIRDCMMWLYGSGSPKSLDISKAIDKAAGAKREVVGEKKAGMGSGKTFGMLQSEGHNSEALTTVPITIPATELAKQWDGWGAALKPAWEPIIVAMKPLDGTFAHNAKIWGVAGLNIDGGRIGTEIRFNAAAGNPTDRDIVAFHAIPNPTKYEGKECQGRWPANLLLDEESAEMLDEQTGILKSGARNINYRQSTNPIKMQASKINTGVCQSSFGGASRFFYCAKAGKKERNAGLEDLPLKEKVDVLQMRQDGGLDGKITKPAQNNHPTVKPLALMEYLCKLTKTPTGGLVLDPFGGSGTTALVCIKTGHDYILIEKEPEYCEIANKRIGGLNNGGVNAVASSN